MGGAFLAMATNETDERLSRALTAYLRQQIQAPATAIGDFLDIIIADARRLQLAPVLSDLDRMQSASARLNAFVTKLIADFSVRPAAERELRGFQPPAPA